MLWGCGGGAHFGVGESEQISCFEVTLRCKFSWSSAKANICTSKRLKWDVCCTRASSHTGWKITWCGSTGYAQLERKHRSGNAFSAFRSKHTSAAPANSGMGGNHLFMMRFHLGWDIRSSSSVAQQRSSSSESSGFVDLISWSSKYSGCCRYLAMGKSSGMWKAL